MLGFFLSILLCHSLRASSPGHSGGVAGKGRRACNYVSGIWISAPQSRCEMLIGGDVFSNDVITHVACFHVFFNVCLHSRWFRLRADWFAEIWQLSRRGTTGELEVEFKFQRRSCKLSFLFPPSLQSAPESLLAGHLCHWLIKHLSHVFTGLKIHHHISIIRLKCMAIH